MINIKCISKRLFVIVKNNLLTILPLSIIITIIFYNAFSHDPRYGYDTVSHYRYINALSAFDHIVNQTETRMAFSPPLPYLIPGILVSAGLEILTAAKVAQIINALMALGTAIMLIIICRLISVRCRIEYLALPILGMLPVFYRSFAFVRGEPYIVFFEMFVIYYSILVFIRNRYSPKNIICLCLSMILCTLSRPIAFFIIPAVYLLGLIQFIKFKHLRKRILLLGLLIFCSVSIGSGWFYLYQKLQTGHALSRKPLKSVIAEKNLDA